MRGARRPARGFSLIELLLASALVLIILAGAAAVGVQLQRQAAFQEQVMSAQDSARAMKETIGGAFQRAGAGLGASRITFGTKAAGADGNTVDRRWPILIHTNVDYSSPPAGDTLTADSNFALPPAPYNTAEFTSDGIDILWGVADGMTELVNCANVPTKGSAHPSAGKTMDKAARELCTRPRPVAVNALFPNPTPVVTTNPSTGISCALQAVGTPTIDTLTITDWESGDPIAVGDDCYNAAGGALGNFWTPNTNLAATSFVLPASGVSLRVNWKSQVPRLEMDADGPLGPLGFQDLSGEVERIKVRLGVWAWVPPNTPPPNTPPVWFPDPTTSPPTPAIDQCGTDAQCAAFIPGPSGLPQGDLPAGTNGWAKDALMRRVRAVEIDITTRTLRRDVEAIAPSGSTFLRNPDGRLRDGYKRRQLLFRMVPRNMGFSGALP